MRTTTQSGVAAICWMALISVALAQSGGGYDLTWSTIDGGGGTSSGGGYELSGTIGQPDASAAHALAGGDFQLTGGFWGVTLPACSTFVGADFDRDCDVDMDDYTLMLACTLGADVSYDPQNLPSGCTLTPLGGIIAADFDSDGDVDADDFGRFQRCISGTGVPVETGCEG